MKTIYSFDINETDINSINNNNEVIDNIVYLKKYNFFYIFQIYNIINDCDNKNILFNDNDYKYDDNIV